MMARARLSPAAGRTLLAIGRALALALLLPEMLMAFQWASAVAPDTATAPAATAIAVSVMAINPDVWLFVALCVLFSHGALATEASARREVSRSPVSTTLRLLRDASAANGLWRAVSAAYAASITCDASAGQLGVEGSMQLAGASSAAYALHPATQLWLHLRDGESGTAPAQAFPACLSPVLALDGAQAAIAVAVAVVVHSMIAQLQPSQQGR